MVEARGREAAAFAAEERVGAESACGLAGGGHVARDPDFGVAGLGQGDEGGGGADDVDDGTDAFGGGFEGSRQKLDANPAHRRIVFQRPEAKRMREAMAMVT